MIKSKKVFGLCVLALVITLVPNQGHVSASASLQEAADDVLKFLDKPRPDTIATMKFEGQQGMLPNALGILTIHDQRNPEKTDSILLVIDNQGNIVKEFFEEDIRGYTDPQMFNETTLMMSGTRFGYLTFWNLETNAQYTIEAINGTLSGHHDWSYNPVTDTFVTLGHADVERAGKEGVWEVEALWEFDWDGNLLWEWNMADWLDEADYDRLKCQISDHPRRGNIDFSHSNTIYWDHNTNIIYINARNLDNVWAIEYPTGNVRWIAGRNGDFTMYDKYGNEKISLWYHSHSCYPVPGEPNKFILFDNDLHNQTAEPNRPTANNWEGGQFHTSNVSRLVEVEINPETGIMRETWTWEAPPEYYSPVWGFAGRLPNGNRVGCFGSRSSADGDNVPPYPEEGGTLVEVNEAGEIVWQVTFDGGMGIFRGRRFQPYLSLNAPADLICDKDVNDCQTIGWTGTSGFKASYQITNDGEVLVDKLWMTKNIYYDLPSDLAIGSHEYTLTVYDLAGQSVSDSVMVTVTTPTVTAMTTVTVFELLAPLGVQGILVASLATVGLLAIFKRKKLRV
jgi:hypothetical protein